MGENGFQFLEALNRILMVVGCVSLAGAVLMDLLLSDSLVSNAVKYSTDDGFVRMTVEDAGSSGVIRVEDGGIGIPGEDLKRIFERLYRTDKSRNRKTGGPGIGLAIVKTIVQAYRGTVTAESEEGKGSIFTVSLPEHTPKGVCCSAEKSWRADSACQLF